MRLRNIYRSPRGVMLSPEDSPPELYATLMEGWEAGVDSIGTWTGTQPWQPAGLYQWQSAADAGFTTDVMDVGTPNEYPYTFQVADIGRYFRCLVGVSNVENVAYALSDVVGPVVACAAPTNTGSPVITGTPGDGEVLSVSDTGTWTGYYYWEYQWQTATNLGFTLGVSNIVGAIGDSYTLQAAEIGLYVRCVMTAQSPSCGSATGNSNVLGPVTA